jgi:hypothetical protein
VRISRRKSDTCSKGTRRNGTGTVASQSAKLRLRVWIEGFFYLVWGSLLSCTPRCSTLHDTHPFVHPVTQGSQHHSSPCEEGRGCTSQRCLQGKQGVL